jgi:hypothetical protein
MSRVYVLNKGGHDYSAAEHYGQLTYCTDGPLNKHDISQMVRLLSVAFEDSDPDDYIILTSLSSLCGVACALFAVKHNKLNLLIYKAGKYYEHHTILSVIEA